MIREIREHFVSLVTTAIGADASVTTAGDVTAKDALESRVRVKLYPRETPNADTTGDLKATGGVVVCDVFSPIIKGATALEDLADALVTGLEQSLGPTQLSPGQLHIWKAWQEAMVEDKIYLHIPVVARWTFLYN